MKQKKKVYEGNGNIRKRKRKGRKKFERKRNQIFFRMEKMKRAGMILTDYITGCFPDDFFG